MFSFLFISWIYFVIINIYGFFIMLIDKKRASRKKWRIPEKKLMGVGVLGGVPGLLAGMVWSRHKTNNKMFNYGLPLIMFTQLIIITILILIF
jgi:uncharacterized membrane protein YsdA (DUF1294 family)